MYPHTFLIYKKTIKYYWFEHDFYTNKGIHEFNNYKEAITYIKHQQLDYAIDNNKIDKSYYRLLKTNEYNEIPNNLNVSEYLNWVTKNNH